MSELIIIIVLILFNGLLAMSEIALISVRKFYLINEIKKGSKSAAIALKLANEPDKFLSTIQIGITVIGILTGIYSGSVIADDFSVVLASIGVDTLYSHTLSQLIIVVGVTYLTLILGELVPKRIGMSVAEKTIKLVARPMYILSRIASPFVWLLAKSTSTVFNLLGLKSEQGTVTEEEIKSMVEEGTKGGEVQEVEQNIVERVFRLGDLRISSLMTHRSDLVPLEKGMTKKQIKEVLEETRNDIYPVIDRDFDNVEGIVKIKDFLFKIEDDDFNIEQILLTPTYFHENMNVYKVLERMKEEGINYALICDEFGSCQGVITLRDILEGLVGDIDDNHSEPDIIKRDSGDGWFVDGQCQLYDFLSYVEREDLYSNDNDFNTIGGLVLEQLTHIPISGETIDWKCFRLEIVDIDGARIDKILVTLNNIKNK